MSRDLGDEIIGLRILFHSAMVAHAQGQDQRAMDLLAESLALARRVGSKWGAAVSLMDLGIVASAQGAVGRAAGFCIEGLTLFRDLGDRWGMARGLHTLGRLAATVGEPERAARLYVAAAHLRETIGAPPRLSEQSDHERDLAAVRATLGEVAFAALATSALEAQHTAARVLIAGGTATDLRGIRSGAYVLAPSLTLTPSADFALSLSGRGTRFTNDEWSLGAGAGMALRFFCQVLGVRTANPEEIRGGVSSPRA